MKGLAATWQHVGSSHENLTSHSIDAEDSRVITSDDSISYSSETSRVGIARDHDNNRCGSRERFTQRNVILARVEHRPIIVDVCELYFDHRCCAQATCKQTIKKRLVLMQISITNVINHSYHGQLRWLETRKNFSSHNLNRPICRLRLYLIGFQNRLASSLLPRGCSLRLRLHRSRDRLPRPTKKENENIKMMLIWFSIKIYFDAVLLFTLLIGDLLREPVRGREYFKRTFSIASLRHWNKVLHFSMLFFESFP